MHSIFSDGTDTPEELLGTVRNAGIKIFSVTDHDEIKSCRIMKELTSKEDITYITGVEFSCKDDEGKYHILGYDFDPSAGAVNALTEEAHNARIKKVRMRIERLRDEYGIEFSSSDIDKLFSLDNPGKPHIGNLLVRYGHAKTRNEAIEHYLNRMKISLGRIEPERAIKAILDSGGIPVLAHPVFGSGDETISEDLMEARLLKLKGHGLLGIEAFYSGFTSEERSEMLSFADRFDLFVTAGSDYHGSNKTVSPGDTGFGADTEMPAGMKSFLRAVGITF